MKTKLNYFIIIYFLLFLLLILFSGNKDINQSEIDLVYKYIDLTDKSLHREGIPQCKKDYDNEELKYSLRSVLENIPWIRKIFIIMPNDKVKFLKDISKINNKIIYIKDKDILGFDSASSISFEFNLWKLKKFGCSDNFIYMNDDCFIGKSLPKSNFFYKDKNKKIVPYVLFGSKINYGQYNSIKKQYFDLKNNINIINPHSANGYLYQKMSTLLLLYKVLNKDIKAPINLIYSPHNALGYNLMELKEIYDLVKNNYKYANECLFAKFRNNYSLQHQTLYNFYLINKYNRKIGKISGQYIDLHNASSADFKDSLYCINTGGDTNYSNLDYIKAKIKMEKLFPKITKYENTDIFDGNYIILSKLNYNNYFDKKVLPLKYEDNNIQKFKIKYNNKDGSYIITSLLLNKQLNIMGWNINQDINNTDNQKWYIIPDKDKYFYIVSKAQDLCLDMKGIGIKNNIICSNIQDTDTQRFIFLK